MRREPRHYRIGLAPVLLTKEANALRRAAGLGLTHGYNPWIADTPEAFASSVAALITDALRRQALAQAACQHAVRHFDWRTLSEKQRQLLRSML